MFFEGGLRRMPPTGFYLVKSALGIWCAGRSKMFLVLSWVEEKRLLILVMRL